MLGCDSTGVVSTLYIINATRENDIGWGRERSLPEASSGVFVSPNLATTLQLKDGDMIYLQVEIESIHYQSMTCSPSFLYPSQCTSQW